MRGLIFDLLYNRSAFAFPIGLRQIDAIVTAAHLLD
jgi:hypothetical protein